MLNNLVDFDICKDGSKDCTDKIQAIIDSMQPAGGTVFFPAGIYLVGSLVLRSNTTIYLEAGATIIALNAMINTLK